ncbi:MAG TPA: formate dehydrogenase accessory sulfurtransferase FdhD [Syntrophomonadaceae bacterium]|nr:formate dehydrogenase accessory sulfurtransferase FdhD [Syntrophomonadaceae bacterium]
MGKPILYRNHEVIEYRQGAVDKKDDDVVIEKPVTLFLNHMELATMICSPGGYEELGTGFLLSEGLVKKRPDIIDISCREEDGLLYIETSCPTPQTGNFLRRHIASCCGKSRAGVYFINDARELEPVQSETQYTIEQLLNIIALLEENSQTFQHTGGVHSAALADHSGLLIMFEDIGRHNAIDKVLGRAFLDEMATEDKCLVLSGRIASEILIKTIRGHIPVLLSRSAPTDLTLRLAEEFNITIVGFARGQNLNIYTHPERILN